MITTASADVPLKGLIYLIRAYDYLLKEFPDLKLVVIGKLREGPTSNELKKRGIKPGDTQVLCLPKNRTDPARRQTPAQ